MDREESARAEKVHAITTLIMIFLLLAIICFAVMSKANTLQKINCELKVMTVELRNQSPIKLPTSGRITLESHYLTTSDVKFGYKKTPKNVTEGIDFHIAESKKIMKDQFGIDQSYPTHWHKEWTPAEGGGHIGHHARGELRTLLIAEMFQGNLYYKKLPPVGTKYLFQNRGKSVVIQMGMELGPSSKTKIAGLTPEAHMYLQIQSGDKVRFGQLVNQGPDFGPVDCLD